MASTAVPAADVNLVRSHFPALRRLQHGLPVAYLDGPGGTQVPEAVAAAVTDYLLHHNANTHWAYPTSQETDAMILEARRAVSDLVGGAPDEIAFGANMTTLAFHLARALGRRWGPGDEIVVSELDHHANVAPWQAVARERGVTLRTVPVRLPAAELALEDVESCLSPRTRLVAIGAASNAVGTINDVARIAALAQAVGAQVFVDAVHYAPHRLIDVHALDADYLACSAYKFYGTHVGILWGRKHRLQELDLPKLLPAPETAPERLETGTQNHEGIAGALAAVNWLAAMGAGGAQEAPGAKPATTRRRQLESTYRAFGERETVLFQLLWDLLGEIPGVTRYGRAPGPDRTATISVSTGQRSPEEVACALAEQGLFVSHGDFYATTVVERLGFSEQGMLRVGISCYTTAEEIERLGAALRTVLARAATGATGATATVT